MPVYLKTLTLNGVKSIHNEIVLNFGKKDIRNFDELTNYNIKSLYGPNGAGKTAVVHAFLILQKTILESNYLADNYNKRYLLEMLNKKLDRIEIKIEFYFASDAKEKPKTYLYYLTLHKKGNFKIDREYYAYKNSEYSKEIVIFNSQEGKIIKSSFLEEINESMLNLVDKRSFVNLVLDYLKNEPLIDMKNNLMIKMILPIVSFARQLLVVLHDQDKHFVIKNKEVDSNNIIFTLKEEETIFTNYFQTSYNSKTLNREQLLKLERENQSKTKFLQIFKPDVKNIEITKNMIIGSSNVAIYEVGEYIDYGDYKIDLEFESAGIKKICNLYSYIKHLSLGGILVIDELDSHINDVYLVKIIEYVHKYTNGQLIFTTHNVSPMETLKRQKSSIDFISISSQITSWTQIGNSSPSNFYKAGMIDGLPFNLEVENLLKVFDDE